MFDSFLLSCFAFVAFLVCLYAYRRMDFSYDFSGRDLNIPGWIAVASVILVAGAVTLGTWYIVSEGGPGLLQSFYIALFAVGFFMSLVFLSPHTRLHVLTAVHVTLTLILVVLVYRFALLQNIIMVAALLWVGPLLVKRLKVPTLYLILFFVAFLFVDTYNVFCVQSPVTFSDSAFLLNGLVASGGWVLGVGDFFLAFLALSAVRRDVSFRAAIILALVIAFARFFIHAIWPGYMGDIPYSLIITPATLVVYGVYMLRSGVWVRQ